MYLDETEARNDCSGEGQQQFNRTTDLEKDYQRIRSQCWPVMASGGQTRLGGRWSEVAALRQSAAGKDVIMKAEKSTVLRAVTTQRHRQNQKI
jgi:hypothetical protein